MIALAAALPAAFRSVVLHALLIAHGIRRSSRNEASGARYWFDALRRFFIDVARHELGLPGALPVRQDGGAGPPGGTGDSTPEWTVEELRAAASMILWQVWTLRGRPRCFRRAASKSADCRARVQAGDIFKTLRSLWRRR